MIQRNTQNPYCFVAMYVFRICFVRFNAATMKWKVIRLELASNWEFPKGSAGRSYLIRLPLTDDGAITRKR